MENLKPIPDNFIEIERFAEKSGLGVDVVIQGIRDGTYNGRTISGQWYIEDDIPTEITIKNYSMAIARIIAAVVFIPLMAVFFAAAIMEEHDSKFIIVALLMPFGMLGFSLGLVQLAFSITMGDEINIKTLKGTRRYAYGDVDSINFGTLQTRINLAKINHLVMNIKLKSRKFPFVVKVSTEEQASIQEILRSHGILERVTTGI